MILVRDYLESSKIIAKWLIITLPLYLRIFFSVKHKCYNGNITVFSLFHLFCIPVKFTMFACRWISTFLLYTVYVSHAINSYKQGTVIPNIVFWVFLATLMIIYKTVKARKK